jgi:hypothetical protein
MLSASRMEAGSAVQMELRELVLAAMAALGKRGRSPCSVFLPVTCSSFFFLSSPFIDKQTHQPKYQSSSPKRIHQSHHVQLLLFMLSHFQD